MYEKFNFKDRIVEKPNTYTVQTNDDGTVTLIPAFGSVLQEGTPINHNAMDHIEDGIISLQNNTNNELTNIKNNKQNKVLSGTSAPSNSLGVDGDIYLQYTS